MISFSTIVVIWRALFVGLIATLVGIIRAREKIHMINSMLFEIGGRYYSISDYMIKIKRDM